MSLSLSFIKALTFRVTVLTVDLSLLLLILDDVEQSVIALLIRHALETFIFWGHEQAWQRVALGIVRGKEAPVRSITKTLTYRVITVTTDTLLLSFWFDPHVAASGALLLAFINSIVYYIHDRAWAVHFPKKKKNRL